MHIVVIPPERTGRRWSGGCIDGLPLPKSDSDWYFTYWFLGIEEYHVADRNVGAIRAHLVGEWAALSNRILGFPSKEDFIQAVVESIEWRLP